MRYRTAFLMAMVLLLASCGDDAFQTTGASTTSTEPTATTEATTATAATTTTEPTTATQATTTTATTTTTQAATTTTAPQYLIDPSSFMPGVFGSPGDPNGSGCAPPGDVLPDGVWFGLAKAVGGGAISFDLGCFFTGAAADAAANEDYGGTNGAEEGFHIRNKNPKLFSVPIAPTAQVYYVDASGPTFFPQSIPLASWPSATSWLPCPGDSCAVWLYVNGGAATGIVEQFLP